MFLKKRFGISMIFALLMAVMISGTAFAHYCTPVDKPEGAGSIGVYNVVEEQFYPSRQNYSDDDGDGFPDLINGGFVTLTDGATFSVDLFAHQGLPAGALMSGPGGDDMCDGVGVDFFFACLAGLN